LIVTGIILPQNTVNAAGNWYVTLVQIGLISFADQVDFATGHSCYSEDLALMTPANKLQLEGVASYTQASAGTNANFSKAFIEAFRLLTNSDSKREPGGEPRG